MSLNYSFVVEEARRLAGPGALAGHVYRLRKPNGDAHPA
jgi:hypothetical protein